MFPLELDIRTMSFITVLFSFGFGVDLTAYGIQHSRFSGLKWVGSGMALMGLAFLLIGLRNYTSVAVSIVAANTVLILGFLFMNLGIQFFRGIAHSDIWLGITVVAANMAALMYYTYVEPSFPLRVFWVSVSTSILSAMCCRNVLRKNEHVRIIPQWILALVFGMFCAVMLARAWLVLNEHVPQDFIKAGAIHSIAFLAVILLLLSVTFGLTWMANEYLFRGLKQYEQIILTTPEGIALLDREGRYRLVNDAILNLFNLSREEVLGKRSLDLFGNDVYENVTLPNVQKAFAGESGVSRTWLELPNREKLFVAITYHPVPDIGDGNSYAAITIKDMTDLYYAQTDKQRIFDLSQDMLCIMSQDGYFIELNLSWTKTLGWRKEELLQSKAIEFVHPEDVEETIDAEKKLRTGEHVADLINRYRTKDGKYKYLSWTSSPDMENNTIYCVARDITDRVLREEELIELSTRDPLTGANNRRIFMQRLDEEIQRSSRYNTPLSLLAMDIDHFKKINDTYGHGVGDKVLVKCVATCCGSLRENDTFGRLGGEEFSVLLPHADMESAHATAERLRMKLSRCFEEDEDRLPAFTVSIGVAEFLPDDCGYTLLKKADDALYRAKNGGRNRVERG